MPDNNFKRFLELREEYTFFSFDSYAYSLHEKNISISFKFNLSDRYFFNPTLLIPLKDIFRGNSLPQKGNVAVWDNLVFHIGMIELVSYWKAACPKEIIIKPHTLSRKQADWWKKLYYHGLGEFFYTNGISVGENDFVDLKADYGTDLEVFNMNINAGTGSMDPSGSEDHEPGIEARAKDGPQQGFLIPVGGGKDSAVTLELLNSEPGSHLAFALNPRQAILDTVATAGMSRDRLVEFYRTIDPELLRLNEKGFLNGHTPFSALLAFNTLLAAWLTGRKDIALSNEFSANEATIPGTGINHQYSKSYAFETGFRDYVVEYISPDFNYFSFLRPLSELQIAGIFSGLHHYHPVFRSCNAGSKTDSWCGACSKCLFTYIILSPFLDPARLHKIFGKDLLADESLKKEFDELSGIVEIKPFECVGTVDEINLSLVATLKNRTGVLPALLQYYSESDQFKRYKDHDLGAFAAQLNLEHNLNAGHIFVLKHYIPAGIRFL